MHVDDRVRHARNPRLRAVAGLAAQANVRKADCEALNAEAARDFEGFWARPGARDAGLAQAVHEGARRIATRRSTSGSRTASSTSRTTASTATSRTATRTRSRSSSRPTTARSRKVTYRELYQRVCRLANGLKSLGMQEGRPRHHLHADVDRRRRRDAGVRAHRRDALGGVRRLLGEVAAGAHHRRRRGRGHHRRRADARRQADAAEGDRRRGARHGRLRRRAQRRRLQAHRRQRRVADGARRVDARAGRARKPDTCEPEWVGAEHPLFILYTSGSTGKPKGVQHSSAGYLLWAVLTMKWVFDIKPTDVFWCTADIGWVTGHTYITYGPLACGATEVVFEGMPTYPDAGRFWKMIEDHQVSVFYTAPTAIRSLIKANDVNPATRRSKYDLSSLRLLGIGRRADQSRSVDVVPRERRRRALPDRRHLVADRNRRPHDHAAAGRDAARARLVHAAAARHHGRDRRRDRARRAERARAASSSSSGRGRR